MAADGRIVIDTAIDTDGFTAGSKELEAAAKRAASNLDKTMERITSALDEAIEKESLFLDAGGSTKSSAFKWMERDIDRLRSRLEQLQAQKTALNTSTSAVAVPAAMPTTVSPAIPAASEQQANRLSAAIATLRARIAEYATSSRTAQAAQLLLQRSASALGATLKGIGGGILKAAKTGFTRLGASIKSANQRMRSGMGHTMGMGLAMSGLFMAVRGVATAFKEGIQNLAKYDKQTNSAMSGLQSSLTQVKNSLGTAFAPILTAVAPALTTLMNLVSRAASAVGEFFAALTGQSTFTRATAVQEDYASSLNGTASAAKNAQRQMSGLDEMNTWQSKESGGSGTGGGSGAGAFETVDITNSPIANFANQIKDLIAKQDFRGVGEAFASKVNAAIGAWDGATAAKDLSSKVKGTLDMAVGFLEGTDWQNLGSQIATFVGNIDWSGLTNSLFRGIGAALGALAGFIWGIIQTAWKNVIGWWSVNAGEDGEMTIGEFLKGIGNGLKNIGQWIVNNVFSPIIDGFSKAFGIKGGSSQAFYKKAGEIVAGLVNGIKNIPSKVGSFFTSAKDKTVSIVNSWKTNIVKKFGSIRTGIQEKLSGIAKWISGVFKTDWSKKLGALGDPVNALLTNIKNIWNGIKTTFNGIITFVKGVFTGNWKQAWNGVKTAFSGVFTTLKSVAKAPLNGLIGLVNGLISALNSMIRGLNKININVPSWVPVIGGKSIGFNLKEIAKVPYLASGAVIPPNAPFTAVLGDQRHGTNLEAPESLIRQIVREEAGRGGNWTFTAQINRRVLFKEMVDEAKLQQARTGKNPFALA